MTALLGMGCKGEQREASPPPPPPPAPNEPSFPSLPPAPTATLDPEPAAAAGSGSTDAGAPRSSPFPLEPPAVVIWRGSSGDKPATAISLRIWSDGSVRFKCGRRGVLPKERVASLVDAFVTAGWNTSRADGPAQDPDGSTATTSVQVTHAGVTHRRNGMLNEAVALVQSVVGPDPCE